MTTGWGGGVWAWRDDGSVCPWSPVGCLGGQREVCTAVSVNLSVSSGFVCACIRVFMWVLVYVHAYAHGHVL